MVHNRQLAAWICAACALCFAHAAGSLSWYTAALIAAGVGAILLYILYLAPVGGFAAACEAVLGLHLGRIVLLLCGIWTALMAGFAAALTAEAFPMVQAYPMVSLTVLLLSAWAAHEKAAVGARVACLILPFLAAFYAVLIPFGWKEVNSQTWQQPAFHLRALCVMILPLGAALLSKGEGRLRPLHWIPAISAAAAALALIALPWGGLHRAVMSISIFGVMERFEALLCAAMSAGGFCLCSLLGKAGLGAFAKSFSRREKEAEVLFWLLAVVGLALTNRQNTGVLLTCSLIFWVILPLIILWVAKSKKDEKRC